MFNTNVSDNEQSLVSALACLDFAYVYMNKHVFKTAHVYPSSGHVHFTVVQNTPPSLA